MIPKYRITLSVKTDVGMRFLKRALLGILKALDGDFSLDRVERSR